MLEEKIYQDYLNALKSKNRVEIDFLSLIRSELKNQGINLKKDKLNDTEVLTILKKLQKRLQDSEENILKSGRKDLIENLKKESSLLNSYLPEPLQDSELLKIIEEVITKTNAASMKDMGKVMKEVLDIVGVRADSKKVSSIVKDKLNA